MGRTRDPSRAQVASLIADETRGERAGLLRSRHRVICPMRRTRSPNSLTRSLPTRSRREANRVRTVNASPDSCRAAGCVVPVARRRRAGGHPDQRERVADDGVARTESDTSWVGVGRDRILQTAGTAQPQAIATVAPARDRDRQSADRDEDERNLRHVMDSAADGQQRTTHDRRNATLRERKERRDRADHPLHPHSRQVKGVAVAVAAREPRNATISSTASNGSPPGSGMRE